MIQVEPLQQKFYSKFQIEKIIAMTITADSWILYEGSHVDRKKIASCSTTYFAKGPLHRLPRLGRPCI